MFPLFARRYKLCHTHLKHLVQINRVMQSTKPEKIRSNIFKGEPDRYKGITVNSREEKCDIGDFQTKLEESLNQWRLNEHRTIWFKVSLDDSDWVPILAKKGFRYHHAKDDHVTMYLWLPVEENCNLPPYAHTLMGVGAVVVNDRREILVVREKHFAHSHLKLPGGYVERGENFVDAAVREVWEETNVRTEFRTLLTLRHAHHAMFDCSDVYLVVALRPLTHDIVKCESEIAHAQWMPVDEYLTHPHVHDLNRFFVRKYLECNANGVKIDWRHGYHEIVKKPYTVYFVATEEEESAGGKDDEQTS